MRGYRCDACRDFVQEVVTLGDGMFRTSKHEPPETWINVQGEDAGLHFCSHACLSAWASAQGSLSSEGLTA